jgi:hypothetical protein
LAHGTEPSSPSQNSPEPRSLLYIVLGALGLWVLSKLRDPIEHSDPSEYPVDSANDATGIRKNPNSRPVRVIIDSIPPPQSPTDEEKAEKERDIKEKKLRLRLELGAGLIALGLLAVNILLWCSTRDASNAARRSSDIAQKQLEMSERPWMSAEFSIDQPIEFQPNGDMGVQLHVVMKNIGHSVATDVRLILGADPEGGGDWFMKVPKEQKEMCEMWRNTSFPSDNGSSTTLFPGESYIEDASFKLTKEQIDKARLQVGGKWVISGISFFGCVNYGFAFAPEHHQTGFNYDLVNPGPVPTRPAKFGKATGGTLSMNIGENIPVSQLKIRRSIFGGFYVD